MGAPGKQGINVRKKGGNGNWEGKRIWLIPTLLKPSFWVPKLTFFLSLEKNPRSNKLGAQTWLGKT